MEETPEIPLKTIRCFKKRLKIIEKDVCNWNTSTSSNSSNLTNEVLNEAIIRLMNDRLERSDRLERLYNCEYFKINTACA